MNRISKNKQNKYVFHGFLVDNAVFCGKYDIPYIKESHSIPNKVIPFSKCLKSKDYDAWVIFYEDDCVFERFWKNPEKYIAILKRFKGVITPDFSLYGDMPYAMQIYNVYRQRALGNWLINNGIDVIPNVRWALEESFEFCLDGLPLNSTIFIGTHGCVKEKNDREVFSKGLCTVISRLKPTVICIYGAMPKVIFNNYIKQGIIFKQFKSEYYMTHRGNAHGA